MVPAASLLVLIEAAACGGGFPSLTGAPDASEESASDVASEKPVEDAGACDLQKPFGAAAPLAGADLASGFDYAPTLTNDELTLLFSSLRDDSGTFSHIYETSRPSTASAFGTSAAISVNGPTNDSDPALTPDGLTLYFQSDRAGNMGDIYVATRSSLGADFGSVASVDAVNTADDDTQPALDVDGSLWLASTRAGGQGGYDLFRAAPSAGTFAAPVAETELNSTEDDWSPTLTADGLTIFFASTRGGGQGGYDIYFASRPSIADPFSTPQPLSELNTGENELPHWLSRDGCRLYLERSQGNAYEMYVATRGK